MVRLWSNHRPRSDSAQVDWLAVQVGELLIDRARVVCRVRRGADGELLRDQEARVLQLFEGRNTLSVAKAIGQDDALRRLGEAGVLAVKARLKDADERVKEAAKRWLSK